MTRVRVEGFTLSLDGYGAGPDQDLDHPLGVGGTELHQWLLPTRTFQRSLFGKEGGTTGVDDEFAARGFRNVGAWILGRNMFGPVRGDWPNTDWKGWWGENPPYHVPVFILTHHARPSLEMEGGTTFHFITGGMREALDRARKAAAGRDVRIGGGTATIRQYLREGLVDELHLAIAPVLLGRGESLFEGVDLRALGYACVEFVASEKATHVVLRRQGSRDAQPLAQGDRMNVQKEIQTYIDAQPEPKRNDMHELHNVLLELMPDCRLWFLDGKDEKGKVVSNPNIGYGLQAIKYTNGKSRDFYQIGISANTTGISVYILGIEDKKYLAETYGKALGKASVTGYCIKFKALKDIDIRVLKSAIQDGIKQTSGQP